ncbi:MAG: hypothetical protein JW924_03305 [Fusobacteriaceae bacterium]|nr:hypothetical protein [Fusobacteriaceae bacterium]
MKEYKLSEQEVMVIEDEILANAKALVGVIMKRFELLETKLKKDEEQGIPPITVDQLKAIYKDLIKEHIYENGRFLKKIISLHLISNNLSFREPKQE